MYRTCRSSLISEVAHGKLSHSNASDSKAVEGLKEQIKRVKVCYLWIRSVTSPSLILDSEDDFHSRCENVGHEQESVSGSIRPPQI